MRFLKVIDPFYLFLRLILRKFFEANLSKEELGYVEDNLRKHRIVLWVTWICAADVIWTLGHFQNMDLGIVVTLLIAPVMVMGGAWFAITFGGIPAQLISVAMSTTTWMFIAFQVSLTMGLIVAGFFTPWTLWPVLAIIYLGALIGCVQYDTADIMKSCADEQRLLHDRLAVVHYREREGLEV